ncbi:TPR-like protein [Glarea lozoyensis ATCC 20868]|uniref:TPR-like protein n=1 Tax=Glarea lozoyensis (strain ATCC 20868 / MF5171) TaxID=1116229 RepID=S3DUD9_GLAL2|nr:TPR-like protein [Glarea lozoyensis ATCC 20868]EPE30043.1 TPR-like protein [Glarea lozoyensis ATCC 20868]
MGVGNSWFTCGRKINSLSRRGQTDPRKPKHPRNSEDFRKSNCPFPKTTNHPAAEQVHLYTIKTKQSSFHDRPEHPDTFENMFELAREQIILGKHAQAKNNWRTVLEFHEKVEGRRNLAVVYNLARVLNSNEWFTDAEEILKSLLPELIEALGTGSRQVIGTLPELSLAIGKQGRYAEAREIIAEGVRNLRDSSMDNESQVTHKNDLERVEAELRISEQGRNISL